MPRTIAFSEPGSDHTNEDAFIFKTSHSVFGGWSGVIADGQGGRAGGGRAAQLASELLLSSIEKASANEWVSSSHWWRMFHACDQAVASDSEAGFTTLAGVYLSDSHLYGASCGDSAVHLCNVQTQFFDLAAPQQKNPQIGSGNTSSFFFTAPLIRPWSVLLSTDGVWKYVGLEKLRYLLQTKRGAALADELKSSGRLPGSGSFSDDFTFILVESDD